MDMNKLYRVGKKMALTCTLFALSLLTSCNAFTVKRHRPTTLSRAHFVFEDNEGNCYFTIRSSELYVYDQNCNSAYHHYDYASSKIKFEKGFNKKCVTANESYLFCAMYSTNYNDNRTIIEIFDKSLSLAYTFYSDESLNITDMECTDKYLYFVASPVKYNIYSLFRYDFLNDNLTMIIENIDSIHSYIDDDVYLFLYGPFSIQKYSDKIEMFFTDNKKNQVFSAFDIKLSINISNNIVSIEKDGKISRHKIKFEFNRAKMAYLMGNKIVFSLYNYKADSKCLAKGYDTTCICGIKESYLYLFDLDSNNLSLIEKYPEGTFLVDYDLGGAKYYRNGGLYIDDILVEECTKITHGELEEFNLFNTGYKDYLALESYYFCYHNYFYGI